MKCLIIRDENGLLFLSIEEASFEEEDQLARHFENKKKNLLTLEIIKDTKKKPKEKKNNFDFWM